MKKENSMEKYKEMPELKSNMVIVLKDKRVMLITQPDKDGCYMYDLSFDIMHDVKLSSSAYFTTGELATRVVRVYGGFSEDPDVCFPLPDYDLYDIYANPEEVRDSLLLWERPPKVKEVTMSEVCEKFGCEVKIIKEN